MQRLGYFVLFASIVLFVGWAVSTREAANGAAEVAVTEPAPVAATSTTTTTFPVPEVIMVDAPTLSQLDGWLQSPVTSIEELEGQVVVVQFWTFGCINCKRTLDNLRGIYAEHGDRPDFEVVGVHSPEFPREAVVENIEAALIDLDIKWPIALDTKKVNFFMWQGRTAYWPRTFVLDREGQIRYDHIGEGKYEELQKTVAYLLNEEA